ncbi:MAG: AAA family ATPase [Planctomycetota bacterium]
MSITARIAFVTGDQQLAEEARLAFEQLTPEVRFRLVSDTSQLFEVLRTQSVDLVFIEFGENPKDLIATVRQIATTTPGTSVAAILRPEGFAENVSESTVMIDAMRAGVCDFLRRPLSSVDIERLVESKLESDDHEQPSSRKMGRVVTFISNKGGVGKSTLATNTAVAIARRGKQSVLLIDGSIQMGVAASLLDLQPTATLTDTARESERLDPTMIRQSAAVHSSGLHLLAAPADAVEAMEIDDLLMARVITLARQTYDVVIVDTFPMFDRVVIATLDLSDRVFIVLENVVPTLLGGVQLLKVLDRIGYPEEKQAIILNRQQRISGSLSIDDISERMRRNIDFVLPYDKRVIAAANSGTPVAMGTLGLGGFGGFSRTLERLADDASGKNSSNSTQKAVSESPEVRPDRTSSVEDPIVANGVHATVEDIE